MPAEKAIGYSAGIFVLIMTPLGPYKWAEIQVIEIFYEIFIKVYCVLEECPIFVAA